MPSLLPAEMTTGRFDPVPKANEKETPFFIMSIALQEGEKHLGGETPIHVPLCLSVFWVFIACVAFTSLSYIYIYIYIYIHIYM